GACGTFNNPGDFIVALNSCEFDGGSHCFQTITLTVNGMSTQAQITDECPGCPCGGLDLSQGLFEFFAPTSVGELSGSWIY
ncbi:RlpA-like double-psi beta-barrel-protein domain-containing protein-containing protein, partial [Suillus clintonianus]|uniref:RlpA-like double-psi beta-barrel-protein domain-containing protein-containing protein n=1 Tax=Suillus clintonianus TaxID=1904413 RepID=UPI001B866512